MAIEKRVSNNKTKYRAIITQRDYTGKRTRITKTFTTKREAREWEIEKLENVRSGLVLNDMNVKVSVLADKWLETVILHEKSDSTYRAFKADMKVHILPMYGHLKISQITKNLVSDLRSVLSKKQLSKSSINRIMASFKSFIRFCIDHGHIIKNPFIGYKELKIQSSQKEFWEKSDIEIFFKNAKDDFYYDLYIFALNTGIRIGEIGALNIEKINFERKTILRVNK